MPYLSVENLNLSYARGPFALQNANFSAEKGEIIALLGPSGCGKTTLLNLIAGFLTPNSGTIRVAGRDVAKVAPHQRDMAMVFQSYALFPHLSVQKNVAYGLEARHVPASEIEPRVTEALEMVGLAGHRQTFPRQLSGGQQQRVALARALVVRPSILLLDEPLSNLDTLLRKTMRQEIHDILKRVGTTAVMVTHDQEEALVIADRILLMSQGRIDQIGSPREIYENPRSVFGARFMASENLIKGTVTTANESVVVVDTAIGQIACRPSPDDVTVGQSVTVTVRPERIAISALPATGDHLNRVSARIQSVSYIGTYERILCTKDGHELIVHAPISPEGSRISSNVELSWIPCDTRVLVR